MTKFVVAILLALTMPASAADTTSANYYLPGCKGPPGQWDQGLCAGFVAGVVYAAAPNLCVPQAVTNSQAVAVVIKYIEARPERMHEQFGDLVFEALTAAWPCKR
jgi:hypothetical protein